MTKAVVILRALVIKRRLKEICKAFQISYKYCQAISTELKMPSYEFMKKFLFLIPANFWFEEADAEFLNQVKENLNKEKNESSENINN